MRVELFKFTDKPVMRHAHDKDVGYDVYAKEDIVIDPGETKIANIGFGIDLPDNTVAFIVPRTSLASRGILVHPCPIDPGYGGEIFAILSNVGKDQQILDSQVAIAQLVIMPFINPVFMHGRRVWDNGKNRAFFKPTRGERSIGALGSTDSKDSFSQCESTELEEVLDSIDD